MKPNSIKQAVNSIKKGKAVVYPTDTAYGLGVDATNERAVKFLYKIKGRKNQPTHIVVSSLTMAKKYVEFDKVAEKIFKKFLPGPLTLILPLKPGVPKAIELLSAKSGTLGVRMPDRKEALAIVQSLKRPITTPSANPAGGKTPYTIYDSYSQFYSKKNKPDLYIDAGTLKNQKPSTLLKLKDGKIKVLRRGPITKKQIQNKLKIK